MEKIIELASGTASLSISVGGVHAWKVLSKGQSHIGCQMDGTSP